MNWNRLEDTDDNSQQRADESWQVLRKDTVVVHRGTECFTDYPDSVSI